MNALLGVGEIVEAHIYYVEWNGINQIRNLVFLGKGVCFDTGHFFKTCKIYGRYDLRHGRFAVVVGLMTLALRKQKLMRWCSWSC